MLVGVVELWSVESGCNLHLRNRFAYRGPCGDLAPMLVRARIEQIFPHACALAVERKRDYPHYVRSFSSVPWMRRTRSAKLGSSRIIAATRSKLWITVE
jgi:hypothetical protein